MKEQKTGLCQICKKQKRLSELMPGSGVRNSVADLIVSKNGEWDPDGYICTQDLNQFRGDYVKNLVEEEKGQISAFDKEVLQSIADKELLSRDINSEFEQKLTWGEKISDGIAKFGGSWTFIIIFFSFLFIWMIINIYILVNRPFDPYPFILLNLILSCLAAIQAPIIMMSQNRQESKDRLRSLNDYQVNLKAELEIRQLNDKMDHLLMQHGQRMLEIQNIQLDLIEEISNRLKK
jgi:uncharacterized membrane protein